MTCSEINNFVIEIFKFKNNILYYFFFRIVRNFLSYDLIINIYNFKVFGSINKNKTSYFLLKKCEFGDYHELNTIKKFSNSNNLLFIDCGSNYGFYSFYTAALSKKNHITRYENTEASLGVGALPPTLVKFLPDRTILIGV